MKMYLNGQLLGASELSELQRAVVISLFTWRRADDTDDYDGTYKYGWWGDTYPKNAGDRIGSKLWQLLRRKLTDDVLLEAEEMCNEALQWLIDDGYATDIQSAAERYDTNSLAVTVTITFLKQSQPQILKFMEI